MRAVLVDDEPLILAHLEKLLQEIKGIDVIGTYSNPHHALQWVEQNQPDVVFLDVEMPELSGIELAEKVVRLWPQINIVFVTAYSEYAVKAFELHAVDYLLKPVKRERLAETVRRFQLDTAEQQPVSSAPMVCCFQSLQFKQPGLDQFHTVDVRWRTAKAKELFAFLLHHRQKPVRKDIILDLFWPETDESKGFTQLYTTIYQIRKTLKSLGIHINIASHDNYYVLDLNEVKLDVEEWEKGIASLSPITPATLEEHQALIDLYEGNYLEDCGYLWSEGEKERLRSLWLNHITHVAQFLVGRREYPQAVILYNRAQEIHPYTEDSYFMLMQLYDKLQDRHSVELQYERLTCMLAEQFNQEPRQQVKDWYCHWSGVVL